MPPQYININLAAGPNTDIWRKPPAHDVFTAPNTLNISQAFPLNTFQSAKVSFKAQWKERFDQAGILLLITEQGAAKDSWIKAGLEFFNDTPQISFVGCDRWADWSVHPVHGNPNAVTVEVRREGSALWAYEIIKDDAGNEVSKHPFRECTWLWGNEDKKQLKVAAYCCRPAKDSNLGRLEVHFDFLEIQFKE